MHVLSMKRRKNAIRIRANFRSQRSLFSRTVLVEGTVGRATTEGGGEDSEVSRWREKGEAADALQRIPHPKDAN